MSDVMVIGGGVVGLTAAIALKMQGFMVTIVDGGDLHVESDTISPRVYAINHRSQKLLTEIGAWNYLGKNKVAPYRHMFVWDALSNAEISFDANIKPRERLGSIIDEAQLKYALFKRIKELNIKLIANSPVQNIEEKDGGLEITCGPKKLTTPFAIITDGANSKCRQLLNIANTTWPYKHQAIVATVNTEKEHGNTAYQVFRPEGPLAFLPLTDKNQCSIVWSNDPENTDKLMELNEKDFSQELSLKFAKKLGNCKVVSKRFQFPLHMRHTKKYCGKNWLLMGDAAHTIHPLAGQGLNLGLADVRNLLELLQNTEDNSWSENILNRYQRQRRLEVWKMISLMEGLKTSFAQKAPAVIAVRGLGLRLANKLNPLKRLFIDVA